LAPTEAPSITDVGASAASSTTAPSVTNSIEDASLAEPEAAHGNSTKDDNSRHRQRKLPNMSQTTIPRQTKSKPIPASYALLDSGSSFIIGPADAVGWFVWYNDATCVTYNDMELDSAPLVVGCRNSMGFDAAMIPCDAPFSSLDFIPQSGVSTDGETKNVVYSFEKDDLMVVVDTKMKLPAGMDMDVEYCLIRIASSPTARGWVLGDLFFNKYYAAFDFEKRRIGLAPSTPHSTDACPEDMPVDVTGSMLASSTPATSSSFLGNFSQEELGLMVLGIFIAISFLNFVLLALYKRSKKRNRPGNVFDGGLELTDVIDSEEDVVADAGYGGLSLEEEDEGGDGFGGAKKNMELL